MQGDLNLCAAAFQSSMVRPTDLGPNDLQVGELFTGTPGQTQRCSLEFQLHARPDAVLDPAPVLQEAGHVVQARCVPQARIAAQARAIASLLFIQQCCAGSHNRHIKTHV